MPAQQSPTWCWRSPLPLGELELLAWLRCTSTLTTCSPSSCSCGLCSPFVSSSFPRSRLFWSVAALSLLVVLFLFVNSVVLSRFWLWPYLRTSLLYSPFFALTTGPWPWAICDSAHHGSRITTPSRCKSQFGVQRAHRTRFLSLLRSPHTNTGGSRMERTTPCREFSFRCTVLYGDGPNLSHFISHGKLEL